MLFLLYSIFCIVCELNKLLYVNCRDDAILVSGTEDGELCLWSMDTYDLQYTIKGKYIFFISFMIIELLLSLELLKVISLM